MEKRMHAGAQATTAPPMGPGAHAVLGLAIPFVAVANAALSVAWILVLLSIFGTGTIFGWPLPPQLPHWGSVLILVAIYFALSAPLRAVRHASHSGWGSPHFAAWGALHGIFWLAFAALFFWLTYQHVPQVHALIDNLLNLWRGSSGSFSVENLARLAHG
jgi:hypothetical protein